MITTSLITKITQTHLSIKLENQYLVLMTLFKIMLRIKRVINKVYYKNLFLIKVLRNIAELVAKQIKIIYLQYLNDKVSKDKERLNIMI